MRFSNAKEKVVIFGCAAIVVALYVATYAMPFRSSLTGLLIDSGFMSALVGTVDTMSETEEALYILPSDSRTLTEEDLSGLDQWTCTLAINELYARYGCSFGEEGIASYFAGQSWYAPDPNMTMETASASFSDIERANLELLVAYAQANGWR